MGSAKLLQENKETKNPQNCFLWVASSMQSHPIYFENFQVLDEMLWKRICE